MSGVCVYLVLQTHSYNFKYPTQCLPAPDLMFTTPSPSHCVVSACPDISSLSHADPFRCSRFEPEPVLCFLIITVRKVQSPMTCVWMQVT